MKRTIVIIVGFILIAGIKVIAQTYNPNKAAEYARRWCNGRNTNPADADKWGGPYIDYSLPYNGGRDCAAFVSQCLLYGGLDLSKGTNGNGAYVKPADGVIAGAKELVEHLIKYQEADTLMIDVNNQHLWAELGDPAFLLNAHGDITTTYHSYICSEKDQSGIGLFSAHTHDVCGTTPRGDPKIHFHIKSSTPAHCTNCVPDGDETGVDCGGSCPPCQHAKNAVNYNYNTSSLPSETRAFESITAGNADVRVTPGQDVTFITAGTVTLKPGFVAQPGSNFKVQKTATRKAVGADCEEFCDPFRPNRVCLDVPPNNNYYGWYNVANASSITITIYQSCNGRIDPIHTKTIDIESDGYQALWDLTAGVSRSSKCIQDVFWYAATVTCCKGIRHPSSGFYEGSISIMNCLKSLSSDSIDITIQEPIIQDDVSPNNEYTIHPNPNTGSFTIQTDNFDNINQIQVINPLGQIIYTVQNPTDNNITLPIGAKGTYFVRITTETESITRKILVE